MRRIRCSKYASRGSVPICAAVYYLGCMQRFAELLDRLILTPGRNAKLDTLAHYFAATPDPDRGYALAALTGELRFTHAKPGVLRALVEERVDAELFAM